jgi:hypothetical protein
MCCKPNPMFLGELKRNRLFLLFRKADSTETMESVFSYIIGYNFTFIIMMLKYHIG